MNDQPQETKRDASSPEEESKVAAREAQKFSALALKRADDAAIAKLALEREKAVKAQNGAIDDAQHVRDRAQALHGQISHQLRSETERRQHLEAAADEAAKLANEAAVKQQRANRALDEANAAKAAADGEAKLKASEAAAAAAAETALRAQLAELETAEETFILSAANAHSAIAAARATYATEVAKIRKAAADRDVSTL